MPMSRRFDDRGETIFYAGRDWQVSRRFPLAASVVLIVESEGGALALVTRGTEVCQVQPAVPGASELSDAVATILYGTRETHEERVWD